MANNGLTGLPAAFQTWGPSNKCELDGNSGYPYPFECTNAGSDTTCCTTVDPANGATRAASAAYLPAIELCLQRGYVVILYLR